MRPKVDAQRLDIAVQGLDVALQDRQRKDESGRGELGSWATDEFLVML